MAFVRCYHKEHFICSFHDKRTSLIICSATNEKEIMRKIVFFAVIAILTIGMAHAEDYLHGQSGTTYQGIGNTTYRSDGSAVQNIGNTTYGSDGTTCHKVGNSTYCN